MVTFFDAFFISKNKNIFAADISELEATDLDSFEISSVDHTPVSQSSYWVFLEKTNTLKFSTWQVEEMLNNKIIKPSEF